MLSAELVVIFHVFDFASTTRKTISDMFGRNIAMTMYTDNKSRYDAMTGINATTEKRLMIDLTILRQAYELREITEIVWVTSAQNQADAMTKDSLSPALSTWMRTNTLSISAMSWVERKTTKTKKETGDEESKLL